MARKKEEEKDARGFWLLATLVVAATVGAMVWVGGKDDDANRATEKADAEADQEVLEVQPLIPSGKITSASWRGKAAAVEEDEVEPEKSMLDGELDPFGDRERKAKAKAEENLKKTIDKIHGLGVYVAPAKEDDDK